MTTANAISKAGVDFLSKRLLEFTLGVKEIDPPNCRAVVDEAVGLGVMAFIIAGGEPFLLPGLTQLLREYPDRLFLVFTNGTALRPTDYEALKGCCANTAIVVSLEGDREMTDFRRGQGVFEKALGTLDRL
jgi:MoaA/NifB/PqqE/SkfB family radical SAM enzyme